MANGGGMMGLGAGLQNFGQAVLQLGMRKHELQQEAIRRALQESQFQRQLDLSKAQLSQAQANQNRQHAQWQVEHLPAGTPLNAGQRQQIEGAGLGAFVRPDLVADASEIASSVQEGLPTQRVPVGYVQQGLSGQGAPLQGLEDSGRGYSIPTEDSRQRAAALTAQTNLLRDQGRAQAAMQRVQYVWNMRNQMQQEKLRVQQAMQATQDALQRQALALRAQQIDVELAKLDNLMAQQDFDNSYRTNVTLPDILNDNATNWYRAQHGGAQAQDPTALIRLLEGLQRGQLPEAPPTPGRPTPTPPPAPTAPPAKRPVTTPTRPPGGQR